MFFMTLVIMATSLCAGGPIHPDIILEKPSRADIVERVLKFYSFSKADGLEDAPLPSGGKALLEDYNSWVTLKQKCLGKEVFLSAMELDYYGSMFEEIAQGASQRQGEHLHGALVYGLGVDLRMFPEKESKKKLKERNPSLLRPRIWTVEERVGDNRPARGLMLVGWLSAELARGDSWWAHLESWTHDSPFSQGYLVACYYENRGSEYTIVNFVGYGAETLLHIYRLLSGQKPQAFFALEGNCVDTANDRVEDVKERLEQLARNKVDGHLDFMCDKKKHSPSWGRVGVRLAMEVHDLYCEALQTEAQRRHKRRLATDSSPV